MREIAKCAAILSGGDVGDGQLLSDGRAPAGREQPEHEAARLGRHCSSVEGPVPAQDLRRRRPRAVFTTGHVQACVAGPVAWAVGHPAGASAARAPKLHGLPLPQSPGSG